MRSGGSTIKTDMTPIHLTVLDDKMVYSTAMEHYQHELKMALSTNTGAQKKLLKRVGADTQIQHKAPLNDMQRGEENCHDSAVQYTRTILVRHEESGMWKSESMAPFLKYFGVTLRMLVARTSLALQTQSWTSTPPKS